MLSPEPGLLETAIHDYVQHGTTALFGALDAATRQVTGICYSRHRHQEFLRFLKKVAAAGPDQRGQDDDYITLDTAAFRGIILTASW